MNKRARQRLIGVTALLFVIIGAIVVGTTSGGAGSGAYFSTVEEVLADSSLIGEKVKVSGIVVPGSWDSGTRPMVFDIRPEDDEDGPTIKIVYDGTVPTTFGDLTNAIITGVYAEEGLIESTEMIVKCPSKYESATDALTVDEALEDAEDIKFARVKGYVVDDSIGASGFTLQADEDGGSMLEVRLETTLPDNVADGTQVVLDGAFEGDVFVVTDVAEVSGE